jgi:hypothetical protein
MTTENTTTRPANITDDHLDYLDGLRESGEANMFGAAPYLEDEFDIDRTEAIAILSYWMEICGAPR